MANPEDQLEQETFKQLGKDGQARLALEIMLQAIESCKQKIQQTRKKYNK